MGERDPAARRGARPARPFAEETKGEGRIESLAVVLAGAGARTPESRAEQRDSDL